MRTEPRSRGQQVTIGLVMIALGLLFFADRIYWLPLGAFDEYWPVILIAFGLGHFFSRERRGGVPWLLVVGVIMLLHTTDVLRLSDSWPLFIVASGLGFIWRGWYGRTRRRDPGEVLRGWREDDDGR